MKIICSVEVLNRTLPSLNMSGKKAVRSCLTIGKQDNNIFLLHQTNENACGKKYKVKDNITKIFVKFLNEGKATIRFKEPEHDLAIKCDPIQLKGFLKTLKLGFDGITSHQLSTINTNSNLNKTLKPVKTKLKITSREAYPVLEGFPRTLEKLFIINANQQLLDSRILRLRNLCVLNMENNNMATLPEQLGASLPNLVELHLAGNNFGLNRDWRWIINTKLQNKLKMLDLSSNNIVALPDKLVKLAELVTLKINDNLIHNLPNGIGCMRSLRYLSASNNRLCYLPGSISLLKLEFADISGNPFFESQHEKLSFTDFNVASSLLDITASCVISKRLNYSEDALPQTLIDYLETAWFCICGKPCFSRQPQSYIQYHNDYYSRSFPIFISSAGRPTVAVRYCSFKCYHKQRSQM